MLYVTCRTIDIIGIIWINAYENPLVLQHLSDYLNDDNQYLFSLCLGQLKIPCSALSCKKRKMTYGIYTSLNLIVALFGAQKNASCNESFN